jgi:cytoskeleton protein RodZ
MSSVGAYLRGLREQQGLSIDELSRATRVLHHYLEALESDDMASLPAPVFTKGFIRAYCQAIGAVPEEALTLYERSAGRLPERPKVPIVAAPVIVATPDPDDYPPLITQAVAAPQSEPRETRSRGTLLVSFILVVVLGAAFFAVTMTLQSSRDGDGEPSQRAALPEPPPAAEVPGASLVSASVPVESPALAPAAAPPPAAAPLPPAAPHAKPPAAPSAATSLPTPSTAPAPSVPAAPVTPPMPAAAGGPATLPAAPPAPAAVNQPARAAAVPYRLIARTTETTWMRVRTEDGRTSEETIPANEIREWISNGPFIITIGNAGGVSLELNGRAIPRLGASGSVITRLVLPSDNQ